MTDTREHGDGDGGGLRAVPDRGGQPAMLPPVKLVREFKGPTVADLLRDEYVARLPGRVWSALRHIEDGDFAAADAALPGQFAPILAGPGERLRTRRRRLGWLLAAVGALAVAAAWALRGGS